MEHAILSSIPSLVTAIVKKLGSDAYQQIQLVCNFETDFGKMKDTISTVQAVLLDMQEHGVAAQHEPGTNHQASVWFEKLKDVVEDVDDLLDDFSTEDLRRKEMMTSNKMANEVCIFFSSSNQIFSRLKMCHKVKVIREKLDAIAENKNKFHFSLEWPTDMQVQINKRKDSHSFVIAEKVIGRNDDKNAIVGLLMNSNVEGNVSVIAIVGIGGLGKTTLAQYVFNDENVQNHFELKMWVCVSEIFDVKQIAKKIIQSAESTMEEVQNKLRKKIDGKKYLLVLDDVWNENHDRWIDLSDLLVSGARGSKILITTRADLVATASGVDSLYPLKSLSEEESWSLFKQIAFKNGKESQNACLVKIGKEISKKCAGVPLAIRALGSLLITKTTVNEWLDFKNKDMAKIAQDENIVLSQLRLSYNHLPLHLKQCFAFCRLYSKGHVIDKQQLIQLWSAHGFIRLSDEDQDIEVVGELYFINLLRRCFFQDETVDEFGEIVSCKMHDLMHDLADLVAGSETSTFNFDTKYVSTTIRHISFSSPISIRGSVPAPLLGAIKARTFFLSAQPDGIVSSIQPENPFYATILSKFKSLRVLDLHALGMSPVPHCISELSHLRYLDLSWNGNIETLPNSIIKLVNLRTLKLLGCIMLKELPRDIRKLVSLRHLELDGHTHLTDMPVGLGQLTSLRTLRRLIVGPCNRLSELKDLNKLRGELSIELRQSCLERPRLKEEAEEANLKKKESLHSLKFEFRGGSNDDDEAGGGELESVLEAFEPHTNMKKLEIERYVGVKLPKWMSSLSNLVEITLSECKGCKHLPKIEQLSCLRSLVLEKLNSVEYIDDDRCGVNEFSSSSPSSSRETTTTTFFPSLKYLALRRMPNLMGWWRSNQAEAPQLLLPSFPCLVESIIFECPKLTSMPLQPTVVKLEFLGVSEKLVQQQLLIMMGKATSMSSSSLVPLSNLEELKILFIKDLVTLPEEAFRLLTSLMKLEICYCPRLPSLSGGMRHLTALTTLRIRDCQELDLSDGDDDGMHFQGLSNLTSMSFFYMPKLESLPAGLQHVTTLQHLTIYSCENLKSLPEWTGNLTSLQILHISYWRRLKSLPEGMRRLPALETLHIFDCSKELKDRCQKETGEDWPKIAHIPKLELY